MASLQNLLDLPDIVFECILTFVELPCHLQTLIQVCKFLNLFVHSHLILCRHCCFENVNDPIRFNNPHLLEIVLKRGKSFQL